MSFFDSLKPEELEQSTPYLEEVRFAEGDCILRQGATGDECYLILEGRVRLELRCEELDTEAVLDYLEAGQVLGEFSLFDRGVRSASAFADSDVVARCLTRRRFEALCKEQPQLGLALLTYMAQDFTHKLRQAVSKLGGHLDRDAPQWADEMVAAASDAQAEFVSWPEERVDALLGDIAEAVLSRAEELAEETVKETGLGVVAHKVLKISTACRETLAAVKGKIASGPRPSKSKTSLVVRGQLTPAPPITEILSPMGVILGLVPLTNPVSTIVFKSLISLKSRNAVILSAHRKAQNIGEKVGEIVRGILQAHGANPNLVQLIKQRTGRTTTGAFMSHPGVSLILATGGPSMVKAAYSSGTPAIGVGAGNAPVWVCPDADPDSTAKKVIDSKSFDNGIICGSDNNLVVDSEIRSAFLAALEENGAAILSGYEVDRFTKRVIDPQTEHLRAELVGKSAAHILKYAGLARGSQIKLIILPLEEDKVDGIWGQEKLAPILSLFTVSGQEAGLSLCRTILKNMGAGHTAIIHTNNHELALRYAQEMPASRILQNCAGSTGCIGIGNGLRHSWTLGCGSWGGTSTTDNVGFDNLLNVKRLALGL